MSLRGTKHSRSVSSPQAGTLTGAGKEYIYIFIIQLCILLFLTLLFVKDYYYILGLNKTCTSTEIKEAYRKLSKKFHPDLNQGDKYFESMFRDIQEAYETLIDTGKKSIYDQRLRNSNPTNSYSNTYDEKLKRQKNYRDQMEKLRIKEEELKKRKANI